MTATPAAMPSAQGDTGTLVRVLMKHPREAFRSAAAIAAQWRELGFTAPPDLGRAGDEFDQLVQLLRTAGVTVDLLAPDGRTGLDSIYVRDASIPTDAGIVLCQMGKVLRAGEPSAQQDALESLGLPILGTIQPPGRLEGGDATWLDSRTLAVGEGYRTNPEGIRQLRALLAPQGIEVITVPLPHWRGPGDVLHLMSLLSPVAPRVAVVYSPLLPATFRSWLLEQQWRLIEVDASEYDSMGTNVLALGDRRVLALRGNPATRAALDAAGFEVLEYEGAEISVKGSGGPTCLTRPLTRVPEGNASA